MSQRTMPSMSLRRQTGVLDGGQRRLGGQRQVAAAGVAEKSVAPMPTIAAVT